MLSRRHLIGSAAATLLPNRRFAIPPATPASPDAATTGTESTDARERLTDLLAYMPHYSYLYSQNHDWQMVWADWERGVKALGRDRFDPDRQFDLVQLQSVGGIDLYARHYWIFGDEGRQRFGFALSDVAHALDCGIMNGTVLRLTTPTPSVRDVLQASGMTSRETEHGTIWQNTDLSVPFYAIAVVDDSTILVGQDKIVERGLTAHATRRHRMIDAHDVVRIVDQMPNDMVNAFFCAGWRLLDQGAAGTAFDPLTAGTPIPGLDPDDPLGASDRAVGPMPMLRTFAMSAPAANGIFIPEGKRGYDGEASFTTYSHPFTAAKADLIPEIVSWRLDNMHVVRKNDHPTYRTLLTMKNSDVENGVARFAFTGEHVFARPASLMITHDMWPWMFHIHRS